MAVALLPPRIGHQDDRAGSTHYHAFTPESFTRYIDLIGGFNILKCETLLPKWSFIIVCERDFSKER